jgi:hypothetical protein
MPTSSHEQSSRLAAELEAKINEMAMHEGWALFYLSNHDPIPKIQRDDEAGVFPGDDEAIEHVEQCAKAGSLFHRLALTLHNTPDDESEKEPLSQNDLDALHAEGFQEWAMLESNFLGAPALTVSTRNGCLPLTRDQMKIIDDMSQREGWLLTVNYGGTDDGKYIIERMDEDSRFATDLEALAFVRKHAEAGHDYHRLALAAHGKLAKEVRDDTVTKVAVTLDIDYLTNGVGLGHLQGIVRQNLTNLIDSDGLVDLSAAEVKGWSISFN